MFVFTAIATQIFSSDFWLG